MPDHDIRACWSPLNDLDNVSSGAAIHSSVFYLRLRIKNQLTNAPLLEGRGADNMMQQIGL